MNMKVNMIRLFIVLIAVMLTSCDTVDRLKNIGQPPKFNKMNVYKGEGTIPSTLEDSAEVVEYNADEQTVEPVADESFASTEMQAYGSEYGPSEKQIRTSNSLWQPGSRSFFRDRRARAVGDILKIKVEIADNASLDNSTKTKRTTTDEGAVNHAMGFEQYAKKVLPLAVDPTALLDLTGKDDFKGEGKVSRTETIKTTVAATVVKILPNGNLVIKGSQEVRVNHELREIMVEGVVRSEDVDTENSVTLDQIAEARVSYGGRGAVSEVQTQRYGKQVLDIIRPF
jgi:flagellar L-ring protein precursor FlgH